MSRAAKSRIELDPDRKKQLIAAIKAHVEEHFEDVEVGDLRAQLLLDFFLQQLAPAIYNQAIRDAAAHLGEKVVDMEGELYEPGPGD